MTETDKLKLIIAVLVLVLFGIGIYYFLHKEPTPVVEQNQAAGTYESAETFDWMTRGEELDAAFSEAFSPSDYESRSEAGVRDTIDITGDGIPEAVVDLGAGGASTELFGLAGYFDGKVTVINFRDQEGILRPLQLMQGAAALHKNNIGISTEENAVYQGEVLYDTTTGKVSSCTTTVYDWNPSRKTFEYSASLSARLAPSYCEQATAQ